MMLKNERKIALILLAAVILGASLAFAGQGGLIPVFPIIPIQPIQPINNSFNATITSLFANSSVLYLESGNITNGTINGNVTGGLGLISQINLGKGTTITQICDLNNPNCAASAESVSLNVINVFAQMQNVTPTEYDDLVSSLGANGPPIVNVSLNLSYGDLNYSNATLIPAGNKPIYLIYDNATETLYNYTVNVQKATPILSITVGGITETQDANILVSSYTKTKNGYQLNKGPYNVSVNVSSSALNNLNFSYSMRKPALSILNTTQSDSINTTKNFSLQPGQQLNITFESGGNANYTAVDPTVYFTVANVQQIISTSVILGTDIVAGNLTITSTGSVTANGHNIYIVNTLTDNGPILSGTLSNGGTWPACGTSTNPGSIAASHGGAGAGGGGAGTGGAAGNSGAAAATALVASNANIVTWFSNFTAYFGGAGGAAGGDMCSSFNGGLMGGSTVATGGTGGAAGGGSFSNRDGGIGGGGSYGIYIQACKITGSGSVNSIGGIGNNGQAGASGYTGGGGGGGGGVEVLAYGSGAACGYTPLTYNTMGGIGGCGGTACGTYTGQGGLGNVIAYSYGTNAPITITQDIVNVSLSVSGLTSSLLTANTLTFTAAVQNGIAPHTYTFYVVNTLHSYTFGYQSYANALTTNTFIFNVPNNALGNYIVANVVVTDSLGATGNSIYQISKTVTASAVLVPASITVAQGNSQLFTANVNGGYQPYTFTYYLGVGTGTIQTIHSGITSNTDQYNFTPSLSGSYTLNVIVTDSGSPTLTENTVNSIMTVTSSGGGGGGGGSTTSGGGNTETDCGPGTVYNDSIAACSPVPSSSFYVPPPVVSYNLSSQLPLLQKLNIYAKIAVSYVVLGYIQPFAWIPTYIPNLLPTWLVAFKISVLELLAAIDAIILLIAVIYAINAKLRTREYKATQVIKAAAVILIVLAVVWLVGTNFL